MKYVSKFYKNSQSGLINFATNAVIKKYLAKTKKIITLRSGQTAYKTRVHISTATIGIS